MADSVDPGLALGMRPVLPRGDEGEQEELERWLAAGGLREEEHARTERRRREAALAALTEQLHGALRAGSRCARRL